MKQLNLYFVILLLISINNYAQETEKEKTIELNSRLKFYFTNGYGAIYQAPLSENTFYRIHADVNIDINDGEYDIDEKYVNNNEIKYITDGTERGKSISVMISPEYGFNLINKSYVTVYFGAGPFFSYSYDYKHNDYSEDYINSSNPSYSSSYPYFYEKKQTTNSYSAGIICFAGIESEINSNFSIFAEFDLRADRTWQYLKYEYINTNDYRNENESKNDTEKVWNYAFSRVKLGVSILL